MSLTRRGLFAGALAAPAIIRTPGLLMAVRPWLITQEITRFTMTITVEDDGTYTLGKMLPFPARNVSETLRHGLDLIQLNPAGKAIDVIPIGGRGGR